MQIYRPMFVTYIIILFKSSRTKRIRESLNKFSDTTATLMAIFAEETLSPTLIRGNMRRAITATDKKLARQKTGAQAKGVIFQRQNTDKCKAKVLAMIGIVDVYKTKLEGEGRKRR